MKHAFKTTKHDSAHGDFHVLVNWYRDEQSTEPWEEHEGHGIVSDWRPNRNSEKRPGELVLVNDRYRARFYDFSETLKIARRDGWGLNRNEMETLRTRIGRTPTAREITAEAVRLDFEFCRKWLEGEIHWVGYVVIVEGTAYRESLWAIFSNDMDHHEQEAVQNAEDWLAREVANAADAASRDIVTV